jgi:malonate transporter and related proteins
MTLFYTILTALAPIIFVTALGWFAGARGIFKPEASGVIATFVVKFALPLALFVAAAKAKPSDILNPPYLGALVVGMVGCFALTAALGRFVFKHSSGEAGLQGLAASFPNMAYCGPPVLGAAVGPSGILAVVIGNLVLALIMMPATLVLLSHGKGSGGGIGRSLWDAVSQPLVFLPVAGVVLALTGVPLPPLPVSAINEIGNAAGGAALFTLGLILSRIRFHLDKDILVNLMIKNFLQPLVLFGAGVALGLHGDLLKEVFLLGVLPAATAVPTLALANQTYAEDSAATVLASTVLSILTISAGIALAAKI